MVQPANLKPKKSGDEKKEEVVEQEAVRIRERMPQISELLNEECHANEALENLKFNTRRDSL
jgi:hypothetical protein